MNCIFLPLPFSLPMHTYMYQTIQTFYSEGHYKKWLHALTTRPKHPTIQARYLYQAPIHTKTGANFQRQSEYTASDTHPPYADHQDKQQRQHTHQARLPLMRPVLGLHRRYHTHCRDSTRSEKHKQNGHRDIIHVIHQNSIYARFISSSTGH